MVEYYDKILIGVAGSVTGGIIIGILSGIGFQTGLFLGSFTATFFMYDAMIRNPPLPITDPTVAASAIVWHAVLFGLALAAYLG
jgi:hypothetical protein